MRSLEGKLALVTGAARGLGLGLARSLAAAGARVIVTDTDEAALPSAGRDVTRAARGAGALATTLALDVTDPASIAKAKAAIHAREGRLDLLVNNAGIVHGGPFVEVPLERHVATYRVNVEGLVAMTHAFLPDLTARPEGHLVNIASASGLLGLPFGSTYASSKWAVIGFSDSLRLELAAQRFDHVHVTCVCPSYVGTGMFDGVRPPRLTPLLRASDLAEAVVRAIRRNEPYVLAPSSVRLLPFLKAAVPRRLFDATAALLGVSTSMTSWRGRGNATPED